MLYGRRRHIVLPRTQRGVAFPHANRERGQAECSSRQRVGFLSVFFPAPQPNVHPICHHLIYASNSACAPQRQKVKLAFLARTVSCRWKFYPTNRKQTSKAGMDLLKLALLMEGGKQGECSVRSNACKCSGFQCMQERQLRPIWGFSPPLVADGPCRPNLFNSD